MSRPYSVRQRIWVLLLVVLGIVGTASLGFWQLGRAQQKLDLERSRQRLQSQPVLDARSLVEAGRTAQGIEGLVHRRMALQGQWLGQYTVYLENRQMNARPGFYVITPFRLDGTDLVIWVQRGWVPRSFTDRTALPLVETPPASVSLQGHLAPMPSRIYDFGAVEDGPIRQNLDLALFRQQTGLPMPDVGLIQTGSPSEGLLRDWPVLTSGVEKHHGYAFQWFGLCALIASLYVWFQIVQPRRKQKIA